jgi:hypothetical protein
MARARLQVTNIGPRGQARAASLPHKTLMVSRYGQRAAHVPVIIGPAVEASLKRRHCDAAALDGVIFLPNRDVPSDLVAHEVVHALQQNGTFQPADADTASPDALLAHFEAAPALPARSAAEVEAHQAHEIASGHMPQQSLPAGIAALRRTGESAVLQQQSQIEQPQAPAPVVEPPHGEAVVTPPSGSAAPSTEIAPTFQLPAMPETALDPAQKAQRDAQAQAAEQALAQADSPSAVMAAYAGMAPSVKARNMGSLGARLSDAAAQSNAQVVASTAPVEVHVDGNASEMPTPPPIALPAQTSAQSVVTPAAPIVDVPEGPRQPIIATDPGYGSRIERQFLAGADAQRIDDSIDAVSIASPGIQSRVTERAEVPLEGANDPALMDQDATARRSEASSARGEAAQAVVGGPGPEQVAPRAMDQSVALDEQPQGETVPLTPAPEAAQLQALALPEEVVAGFDSATSAQMAASAAATRDELTVAETKRDEDHQAAVVQAETEREAAEQVADEDQRCAIGERRTAIQGERQRTVDAQASAVNEVNTQAETTRQQGRSDAQDQVARDRQAIDAKYDQAERDSADQVARGEREAQSERERKRRESENQSWWERAVSFIKDAFEALTRLVNAIFDAVRSAVTAIIDVARRAVVALIEVAARALQGLISAFGALLKGLVNNLLGTIFPELAAALTHFIDEAVSLANAAIDAVANVLIGAVNAIAAALTSALNALLDLCQSAVNAALSLAQAALTGDWSALLRQVLEAVLRLLGIDPQAFYALIAQATDAIEIIVNDPMHFVRNLISAFVGGVQLFADNFLGHLRRGIIGWLTGALGDITLPTEWNIWGVLDLARQVLGLTWDFLRERASRIIGAANVARLEMAANWIGTLITEGWSGLWTRIQGELESLKETVLSAIKSFILERVIMASISWLAGLFNPVGAIVKLVMTIWNLYQFVRNQMQRLMGLAQAVVGMISNIAHDVLDPAKQRVEEILGNLLPTVIDLLMSLLGVTGVAGRVREIIQDVRRSIAQAADRLIQRVMAGFGRGGAGAASASGSPQAAGAAGQIGHPVRIDVAEGEDHTLTIDRVGAGGATVMLRSEPRPLGDWLTTLSGMAARETDAAKKTAAERDIATARGILTRLDPLADRAAATPIAPTGAAAPAADVGRMEDELGPVMTRLFNGLGPPSIAGDVRTQAIEAAKTAMAQQHFNTIQGLQTGLAGIRTGLSSQGLTGLEVVGHGLETRLSASASPPLSVTVSLSEVFSNQALQPNTTQFRAITETLAGRSRGSETIAIASVNGIVVASAQNADSHAESELLQSAGWQQALARADLEGTVESKADLAITLNRSPCKAMCTGVLSNWMQANARNHPNVRFMLIATGRYSPSVTKEDLLVQLVTSLEESGHELKVPFSVLMEQPRDVVVAGFRKHFGAIMSDATLRHDEITDQSDLQRLASAGWILRQLQTQTSQSPARGALANMIRQLGQDLGSTLRVTS